MRGLAIMNPAGFAVADCLEVHPFTAKADLFSLLGGAPVLDMSTIDVSRVTVVTNANGITNLDLMSRKFVSDAGSKPNAGGQSLAASRTSPPSSFQFLVRKLDIPLNEVVLKDERQGKTALLVHSLAFKRSYNDVTPETRFNATCLRTSWLPAKRWGSGFRVASKGFWRTPPSPSHQTYAWGEKAKKDAQPPSK